MEITAPKVLDSKQSKARSDLWPWSATFGEDGELSIGGYRVTDLAEQFGTPLFVIDLADLSGRATVWATAMAEEFWDGYGLSGGHAYYAGKAFLCGEVVRRVSEAGMGIDTASETELRIALAAGADPNTVGLHGNNKTDAELRLAVENEIGRIVIDAPGEAARIQAVAESLGKKAKVMMRVTTGIHAGGHEYISTAHEDQKFGLSLTSGQAQQVAAEIRECPNLELVGIHSHIGSQIFELEGFGQAARKVLEFRHLLQTQGFNIPEVDLGGGYAVAYTSADPVAPQTVEVARFLAKEVKTICSELGCDVPAVSVEPGRSVIAPTTVTLYRVGTVKDVPIGEGQTRRYVSVDGGMSDNIRPALYGAQYAAVLANHTGSEAQVNCRIVGKHCESGDIIVSEVLLPEDLESGDILAVAVTGAYGYAMSSNYNLATRPAVIGIDGQAVKTLIARETPAEIMGRDLSLERSN